MTSTGLAAGNLTRHSIAERRLLSAQGFSSYALTHAWVQLKEQDAEGGPKSPSSSRSPAESLRGSATSMMCRLPSSASGGSCSGCTMMAVRLRYSFRVNSRKAVSSKMGTLCRQ